MQFFYCVKSTKNLDIHNEIFKSYPDPTYLVKIRKLNRPLIEIKSKDTDKILALAVLNKFERHVKICLILKHPSYKLYSFGNKLIKIILDMFNDEFMDADTLYTVCPHQFNTEKYQNLLIKNNFQLSTIKANGDLVYTYAKSI